jgi:thioredoxin-like negative regulator of GroEL
MKGTNDMSRATRLAALIVGTLIAAAPANAEVHWYKTIEEGTAAARELNKPLLVDFWADWCAACNVMEKDVYPTAEFAAASAPFVLVRIDADHRTDLARKYNVGALPMLLFTDSYGGEIFRHSGFLDVRPFAELLKSLPHDVSTFNGLTRVLAQNKDDFEALAGMGRALRAANLYRTSIDYYTKALQRREAKADPARREVILSSLGANYLDVKEGKRAADVFQRCLKEFPASERRSEWTAGLTQARALESAR